MKTAAAVDNRYTRGIASYVSGLRYEDIPQDVITRIKRLILDSFGCGLYAADLDWSRILLDTLGEFDTSTGTSVWGTARRLSAPHAVLVNGTQVQGFEIDDVHHRAVLHVGAVVLPALIAIAENRAGLNGRQFLAAAVAGYEVGPRVGLCMGPEHIGQGWHSGATVGVFASAAATAAALSLDEEKTIHALGIAGTQSSGLMAAQYGAMAKRMHAGRASQSGFYGATLAARGFTGIVDVFESPYGGFCTTLSRSTDRFNLEELTSGLGSRYETMGIHLKFYSSVGGTHNILDAVRELQAARDFGADDVEKVVIRCSKISLDHSGWPYRPEGVTSAQLNQQYCVATMLLEREVFVDQFSEALVADTQRLALIQRIHVEEDPEITARGRAYRHMVHVEIRLKDETVLRKTVDKKVGSDAFPDDARIVGKFENLARRVLPRAQVDELRDAVLDLEKIDDASRIAWLLEKSKD